jgi:selenocysteine lyase/cysteine desulfurase
MPVTERCVYLQTGVKGPMSRTVYRALCDAHWLAASEGPAAPAGKLPLLDVSEQARGALANLLNTTARQLCWSSSTSAGIRTIMHGLKPNAGDILITSDLEHGSTRSLCAGLRDTCGVTVETVAAADSDEDFLSGLKDALDKTGGLARARRILLLSHVSCVDGRRMPVREAVQLTREAGGVSLIDGAQAVGQVPVDLQLIAPDFYVASGHKWLLGPAGVGYIFVREEQLSGFNPNWLSDAERANADAAKRGESGSVDYAGRVALLAAIEQTTRIGVDNIASHIAFLGRRLREGLRTLPDVQLLGPDDPQHTTGLVGFTVANHDAHALNQVVDRLYREHRIAIKYQPEKAALRVSLAAFNTADEVDLLLNALRERPTN